MDSINELLETTCKNMIQTILRCLSTAYKGTIYRIGPMPTLQAVRVTSGARRGNSDVIEWGLPSNSDYNAPGKSWLQYRDQTDRPLEAMGWCVERQTSWTAENPYEDVRSVAKQLRGEIEDFHHMEPVLVKKTDLYGSCLEVLRYPRNSQGQLIWQDTEYVVVAVVKIHFLPYTIRQDDQSTRIIRELSRALGTEILTLQLRETLSRAHREFARQRLQSCEILAHELRNTLMKFAFIFSAINSQLAMLRQEWEAQLRIAFPHMEWKHLLLQKLEEILVDARERAGNREEHAQKILKLLDDQREMASLCLLPYQDEQWLNFRILPGWKSLLTGTELFQEREAQITDLLGRLKEVIHKVVDPEIVAGVKHLPEDLCRDWVRTAYVYFTADRLDILDEACRLLDHPRSPIAHKYQIKRVLISLKALVEMVPEIEEKAGRIILSLRFGESDSILSETDNEQLNACALL